MSASNVTFDDTELQEKAFRAPRLELKSGAECPCRGGSPQGKATEFPTENSLSDYHLGCMASKFELIELVGVHSEIITSC